MNAGTSGEEPYPRTPFGDCQALPGRATTLADAVARADALGKPLLLLIVGEDNWKLGQAYGAWLQHPPTHVATALSLVEVAVATSDELQGLAGGEPDSTVTLAFLHGSAGARRVEKRKIEVTDVRTTEKLDNVLAELNGAFVEMLTKGHKRTKHDDHFTPPLMPSLLEKLAARSRAASGCEPPSLDDLLSVPLSELDRHAAPIAFAAARLEWHEDARRDQVFRLLAEAARARLVSGPITDRPWATYSGCGTNIDGEQPELVGCGMGHVPDKARRFLYLYTKAEREGTSR